MAAGESIIMLVEIGLDLAGCVELTKRGSFAGLGMLAVRPELQDRGIGRAIIREAERVCRDKFGVNEIRMLVPSKRRRHCLVRTAWLRTER